jgi:hypothetical protein
MCVSCPVVALGKNGPPAAKARFIAKKPTTAVEEKAPALEGGRYGAAD